jgi:hypothetical protein
MQFFFVKYLFYSLPDFLKGPEKWNDILKIAFRRSGQDFWESSEVLFET